MIDWNKYFDYIFVISRCINFEMREKLTKEFDRIGLTNYHWWYNCDNMLINYDRYKTEINTGFTENNIRCTFGHYTLIKTAYELGYDDILICEDDIRFLKDINEIENQLNIFLENKNKCDGYYFDYLVTVNNSIVLGSCYYINRKVMKYLIYCMEHFHLTNDSYIMMDYLYPSEYISLSWPYIFTLDESISEYINIPIEKKLLPIQIMLSPKLICIQPDKLKMYNAEYIYINKEYTNNNLSEYNL